MAAARTWLVTGAAGFIGSNLVERLLRGGHRVVGLDNFATGHRRNLDEVQKAVGADAAARFRLVEGDVRELDACRRACQGVDVVLHQAALGSVPRSLKDPLTSHQVNVDGTLHVFLAARDAGVKRVVYASSSSVYGDHPALPKVEEQIGKALSPYAVTKRSMELYAQVFADAYRMELVGLRYFNVFGRRQDPEGPYAAVIPRWIAALLRGEPCVIYGDGETSRDFCYVDNVVQANLLAGTAPAGSAALNQVFNIAYGARTTLTELNQLLRDRLPNRDLPGPQYQPFREGDIRHSLADVDKARRLLGYAPTHSVAQGLDETMGWYLAQAQREGR
jgi:UDP-N-acetylglucosamine 4-epimerase